MRTTTAASAALAAAVITMASAAPALAATTVTTDPKDIDHGVDLRSVTVRNNDIVTITTKHTDLVRDFRSGAGGSVFIDTDGADAGPEFVFVGGYFEGTDYMLLHTEGFKQGDIGEPVEGRYRMTLDYAKNTVRMQIASSTLGSPARVRVADRVAGERSDGTFAIDWLGRPGSYTPWVAKG